MNVEVEKWARSKGKTVEECEVEMKEMERDNKDKVVMWMIREWVRDRVAIAAVL